MVERRKTLHMKGRAGNLLPHHLHVTRFQNCKGIRSTSMKYQMPTETSAAKALAFIIRSSLPASDTACHSPRTCCLSR
eukprot:6176545-Pleurochrysis_carterae.AAC.1